LKFFTGERVDFVLNASHSSGIYNIIAESQCEGSSLRQTASLRYVAPKFGTPSSASQDVSRMELSTDTQECGTPDDDHVCLGELEALDPVEPALTKQHMDFNVELPFDFTTLSSSDNDFPLLG
jgi:hypothetical protein